MKLYKNKCDYKLCRHRIPALGRINKHNCRLMASPYPLGAIQMWGGKDNDMVGN